MIFVRCAQCVSVPMYRATRLRISAEPVGYPDGAIICGIPGCNRPGLVWLVGSEAIEYRAGRQLVFPLTRNHGKLRMRPPSD
jgi:hypothetical protein